MKKENLQIPLSLVIAFTIFVTGCNRSIDFSTVLEGGFDPIEAFRNHGYDIESDARGEGIRNAVHGYGWQSWCGLLTHASDPAGSEAIAIVIRDELNRALGGTSLDELTMRPGRSEGQPLSGMLRYNKGDVHGDVHVWLTPATDTSLSYVIFVREERLK